MRLAGPPELLAFHGADVPAEPDGLVWLGDEPAEGGRRRVARHAGRRRRGRPDDRAGRRGPVAPGTAAGRRRALRPAGGARRRRCARGGRGGNARADAVAALAAAGVAAASRGLPALADQWSRQPWSSSWGRRASRSEPGGARSSPPGASLVAPRAAPAFGFAAGVDQPRLRRHGRASRGSPSPHTATGRRSRPSRILGRVAVEAHRASTVLARLTADLE
jgi:hypothetical protein